MLDDIEPVLDLLTAQTESGVLVAEPDGRLLYLNANARALLHLGSNARPKALGDLSTVLPARLLAACKAESASSSSLLLP